MIAQLLAVIRLELGKTFLSRRAWWIYVLALAPILLYMGRSIYAPRERQRLERIAAYHPIATRDLRSLRPGVSTDEVKRRIGQPYTQHGHHDERSEAGAGGGAGGGAGAGPRGWVLYRYTDGRSDYALRFVDGKLVRMNRTEPDTLGAATLVFATVFQLFYLRLAVFFGCAGIFMNLFRGEMLDRSLHFYLLTPIRREVLLFGKYLAGLLATIVIFSSGTALQLVAMLWQFSRPEIAAYLAGAGWSHIGWYLAVTALACIGYGSLFLAAGLFIKNPIIPAAVILLWESVSLFVPEPLKHASLIFHLQSLCPIPAQTDADMPLALKLLISTATPSTPAVALSGVAIFTALVLLAASLRARRLEINYGTD